VTNKATASGGGLTSNQASATVTLTQIKTISLAKSANPTTYSAVGQTITYSYTITNTGNVTLASAQYKVSDDHINGGTAFTCGSSTTLAPNATVTCTNTYTITAADLSAGSVTNKATASGGGLPSNQASATVKANLTAPFILLVTPDEMGQGAVNQTVYIIGLNFETGTWTPASVQFSGTGITVNSVTRNNWLLLTVNVSISSKAATTFRDVTVINPDGGQATDPRAFEVDPAPVVSSVSPSSRGQGATNQTIVISGANFLSGSWPTSSVTFSGTAITVNSVTQTDSAHLTVNVSIAPTAPVGPQSVTVTNLDAGVGTLASAFTVNAAPTVTSLSPSSRGQGATSQTIVLTGSNFLSGSWPASAVTFSGSGITVNSVTWTNSTHLSLNVSIATNASVGPQNVTVTNLDAGIGSLANAFTVNAAPTVTSLSPNALKHGLSNQTVTVTGTGFVSGATVTFSGGGITVNSVTYTSPTTLKLVISLSGSTATGARNVTVMNPDAGWFTLNNGFTVLN
jgi:hypothetical protein